MSIIVMRIIARKIANIIVSSLAVVNSWTRHRLQWLFVCETRKHCTICQQW